MHFQARRQGLAPDHRIAQSLAEENLDVVGCGSMVVDLFYRTPRIIRADEKILLRAHTASAAIERTQVGGLVLNHSRPTSKRRARLTFPWDLPPTPTPPKICSNIISTTG